MIVREDFNWESVVVNMNSRWKRGIDWVTGREMERNPMMKSTWKRRKIHRIESASSKRKHAQYKVEVSWSKFSTVNAEAGKEWETEFRGLTYLNKSSLHPTQSFRRWLPI